MKKIVLILLLVLPCVFMGCSKDENTEAVNLPETQWIYEFSISGITGKSTLTFLDNTNFVVTHSEAIDEPETGTYTSSGSNVTLQFNDKKQVGVVDNNNITFTDTGTGFNFAFKRNNNPIINRIVTYTDVEFSMKAGSTEYARFFSTETGKSYKNTEVTAAVAPKIDLVFKSYSGSMEFFHSLKSDYVTPAILGATETKITNYVTTELNVNQFDAMVEGTRLAGMTIEDDNESFLAADGAQIILFQNAAGKKGAIKVKAVNSLRLLVDIKVQK